MSASGGPIWAGVFRVAPSRGDHRVALRAAISVGGPLVILWAIGRLDLSIYASFGAFAALYGRNDGFADRVRMQASAGAVVLAAMVMGTALSLFEAPPLLAVLAVSVLASVVTLLAYAMQWHPPGALFVVFAIGATASIPASPRTFVSVLIVGGASVVFALAVTVVFAVADARAIPTMERSISRQPVGNIAWEMAVTVGAATMLAGAAGWLLLDSHWYWAMVGAVAAVSGAHVSARVIRGLQRLVGTLLGVLVAAGILCTFRLCP